jgi:histone acetyltransferase (RNA polymerase elongator complex component)
MPPDVRPLVIPVFLPQAGCPGRCLFCDQRAVSANAALRPDGALDSAALRQTVSDWLARPVRPRAEVEIAFFGGSFLGLPQSALRELLDAASEFIRPGAATGIRFSTRPDTVTPETLAGISGYPVSTVELGAQTMSDYVLRRAARGHTARDTVEAHRLLRNAGYRTGLHLMAGLPGDTPERLDETTARVVALKPDFIRLHPALVLKGSGLAKLWQKGRYSPLSLEEAVETCARVLLEMEHAGIPAVRVGVHLDGELLSGAVLAGPVHPAFGHLVRSAVFREKAALLLGGLPKGAKAELRTHPSETCLVRGYKNENLALLARRFSLAEIRVTADSSLTRGRVAREGETAP